MDLLRSLGIKQHHIYTFLHYTNLVTTFLQSAFKQTLKTTTYVMDSFKPETYCFFHNQYIAVKVSDYNIDNATSPRVSYYYDKDSGFYKGGPEYSTSRLNILAAYLYHHNLRVADLSEFFYSTTYESAEGIPQLGHWIAAWQLKTKTYLDVSKQFSLHFMTVLGERVIIEYDPHSEQCKLAWAAINNNVHHMNQRTFIADDESESEQGENEDDDTPVTQEVVQQANPSPTQESTETNTPNTLPQTQTQTESTDST